MELNNMSKADLESEQVKKELEYQNAVETLALVEIEDNELALQIAELQVKRKRLATALTQGTSNVRRVNSELRNLKTMLFKRIGGM